MKKILITWIIIAVLLVGGLTFIGWRKVNKYKEYYDLEKKLVESTKIYFGMYPGKFPSASLSIKSDSLKNEDMLDGLFIGSEECVGYVIVKKQPIAYKYQAFIKCNDYKTNKYDEQKYAVSDL